MGFGAFSVEPVMIPYLAKITTETTLSRAEVLAHEACTAKDSREVRALFGLPTVGMG